MRRLLPLLLFAAVAHAAEVRLGPETAVSTELPGESQRLPIVASRGGHLVTLWRDESARRLRGVIDGNPFSFDATTSTANYGRAAIVAAGDRNALVVWSEGEQSTRALRARRVSFGGTVLDAVPIELGSITWGLTGEPAGMLFDDIDFVVTWPVERTVHVARVSSDGFVVRNDELADTSGTDLRPARSGGVTVIARVVRNFVASPIVYPLQWLSILGSDGTIGTGSYNAWNVAAAANRVTFIFQCPETTCPRLIVAQQAFDGSIVLPTYRVFIPANTADVGLVWNGAEYVAAFLDADAGGWRVRAIRITATGEPIDAAPFDVARVTSASERPSLAVTQGGVVIIYNRTDASGGPLRVYSRTLYAINSIPRRPAVRH